MYQLVNKYNFVDNVGPGVLLCHYETVWLGKIFVCQTVPRHSPDDSDHIVQLLPNLEVRCCVARQFHEGKTKRSFVGFIGKDCSVWGLIWVNGYE